MPVYNELWQAVKKKQYEEIETLIRNHPEEDLVNSIDEDGDSLLSRILTPKIKPLNLILLVKFMAKQPTLNLNYHTPDSPSSTNLYEVILSGLEIFTFFENNPGIIGDEKKLAYAIAKNSLVNATTSYERELKKNPESDRTKQEAQRIEQYQAILERLHDLTIRHAVATNDINLLKRLQAAGDDLSKPLANGTDPTVLAAVSTPEIAAMFNVAPEVIAVCAKASQNRSAMFAFAEEKASEVSQDEADTMENILKYVRLMQQQQNITLESDLAQIKIYDESNDVLQLLYDSIK